LRYTYYSLASTGRDINFDVGRIQGFRNFCNKIWNAARYVLMNTEQHDCGQDGSNNYELTQADKWIVSRLQKAEQAVADGIANYRFDLASQALYDFIWNEYCDWYLELSKPVLWNDEAPVAIKKGTRRTLIRVFEATLRLAHPLMPFITEEIWQRVAPLAGKTGDTVMLQPYPIADQKKIDEDAEAGVRWIQLIIEGVRNIRGEMNIAPGKKIPVLLKNGSETDKVRLQQNKQLLSALAKLESIIWLNSDDTAPAAATQLAGEMEILVPMADLIDKDAELARLNKEIEKINKQLVSLKGKLSNANFVDRAPAAVVEKEQQRLARQQIALEQLLQQQITIKAM
jgi:valyl-tRNA synthetase